MGNGISSHNQSNYSILVYAHLPLWEKRNTTTTRTITTLLIKYNTDFFIRPNRSGGHLISVSSLFVIVFTINATQPKTHIFIVFFNRKIVMGSLFFMLKPFFFFNFLIFTSSSVNIISKTDMGQPLRRSRSRQIYFSFIQLKKIRKTLIILLWVVAMFFFYWQ